METEREKIRKIFADPSLSPAEKQAQIQLLQGGGISKKGKFEEEEDEENDPGGTFLQRYQREEPKYPQVLERLLAETKALAILEEKLDIRLEADLWQSAVDCDDDFGFKLWGENEVMRFACQVGRKKGRISALN
jgi:hypothetical protein